MAQTLKTYVGDGSTTIYTFEFDYISKSFVKVLVDAVEVGFTFTGTYQITLDAAPEAGAVIIIQRQTDKESIVDFVDGSVLVAKDLNISTLQAIHIAAEAESKAAGSLLIDETGAYNVGFRRLANLGDPTSPRDAVTKDWAETSMTSALSQANTAASSASNAAQAAQTSEVNAGNSASAASTSAADAENARDTTISVRDATVGAQDAAAISANAAAQSETNAATSATDAAQSATDAAQSATDAAASAVAATAGSIPTGAVMPFLVSTPPSGWLEANGQYIDNTYPELRAMLISQGSPFGSTFISVEEGTHPNLIDLRGEFIRGWDNNRGTDFARTLFTSQADAVGPHKHAINHVQAWSPHGSSVNISEIGFFNRSFDDVNRPVALTSNPDTGGADETRPRNVALMYCVRT